MSRGLIDRVLAAVTDKLTSTDWAWLINQPNTNIRYRKKNGFVIVNGSSTVYNIPTGGVYIATLPDGFRPDITLDNPASALGGTSEILVRIMADGRILLLGNPATTYWSFTFTFPISGGGVVTYLLTRLTRLAERRWRHESGVDRQGIKLPCRQLQSGAQTRERHKYNGCWRLYRHLRSRRDNYTNSCNSKRRQNGITRRDYSRRCGRVVYSCSRKGHSFTLQKHVGELVHGLFRSITPERGCAA